MKDWQAIAIGVGAGLAASLVVWPFKIGIPIHVPKPSPNDLGTEGHPCGPGLFGDVGPCKPDLLCEPDFLTSTCVSPETKARIDRAQLARTIGPIAFATLGGYLGFRALAR